MVIHNKKTIEIRICVERMGEEIVWEKEVDEAIG